MKTQHLKFKLLAILLSCAFHANSQQPVTRKLNVKEAIEIGLKHNKELLQERIDVEISSLKEKDLLMEQLPSLDFKTGYKGLAKLRQFENGILNKSTAYNIPTKQYEFGLDAEIAIYEGGKIRNEKKFAALNTVKSGVRVKMDERKLRLQIITAFFKVLHLEDQHTLITDKLREDEANIKQIKLMQVNGLVTSNEVLRTQLQLSNHKLALSDISKEIAIIADKLKPMLGIEDSTALELITKDLIETDLAIKKNVGGEELALASSEQLQLDKIALKQHDFEKKIVRANALPKISAGAVYNYSYPNFLFFPPQEFLYRFGSAGVSLSFPISGIYKNRQKMKVINEQHHQAKLKVAAQEEIVKSDLYEAQLRYQQAADKIDIANEAIAQAKENYRIVKMKYTNQLSLITELIDADNAYLEARSNLISLAIDKQLKYYQLQYRLGNI